MLGYVAQLETAKLPGTPEADLTAARERVARALDTTRNMSDTEFELKKEELCKQLKGVNAGPQTERVRRFRRAYFLLIPGSVEVYDKVIARLDRRARTGR